MSRSIGRIYEFGPFRLIPQERLLLRDDGQTVALTPKVFDVLLALVRNSGHLMERDELVKAVWADSFVEEGNLTFSISTLRKALGEGRNGERYIETIPRRGYRFVASVRIIEGEGRPEATLAAEDLSAPPGAATGGEEEGRTSFDSAGLLDRGSLAEAAPRHSQAADTSEERPIVASGLKAWELAGLVKRHRVISAALALIILGGLAAGCALIFNLAMPGRPRTSTQGGPTFQLTSLTRLTTGRNVVFAAISPDGKYVVYAVNEVTRQSLWVRQVATNSHAQIANRAEVNYFWLEFSKDGNYILYVMATGNNPPALYQMPVLGGTSRKLLEDLTGPIGLSPDGKQFAFIRRSPEGEVALMVANAFDKDGERKLVTRRVPNFLFNPAWSPDGRSIACLSVSITAEGNQTSLIEVRVEDGAEKMLTPSRWKFGRQALWIPDGSGLLMIASEGPYGPYQIWHISYPDGAARRVTNDLNNYGYASLTSDSGALVTVLHDVHPLVWVVPKDQPSLARQVTSGPGTSNDYWGLSWTPDGRIIYGSMASGHQELWVMNADGSDQKQLTADARSNFDPTVSPDGRQIVFSSNRAGSRKIWRMDIDGNNLKQLTDGSSEDYLPYYAPDGRSVVYTADDGQKLTIWKVSSEGGEPQRLTDRGSGWPAVSPDGKLVACWYANESAGRTELAIIPVDGGQPIKLFEVSSTVNLWAEIRWSPDGKELIYIDRRGDVSNLWAQSLEGGAPKQMTDFKEDQLFRFDWSRDGKRLVCSRGVESNDLVLIANSR